MDTPEKSPMDKEPRLAKKQEVSPDLDWLKFIQRRGIKIGTEHLLRYPRRYLGGGAIILLTATLVQFLWIGNGNVKPLKLTQTGAPTTFTPEWENVAIGGGGYVTGIVIHPQDSNVVYIKTDNGGSYRWDEGSLGWIPLNDEFDVEESHYSGVEAIALDPTDPNIVYMAAGKYLDAAPGTLFKSSDRGETWVKSNLQVQMGGDEHKRWTGQRIAVNPFNPNLLFFGSRQQGLWKSEDGGSTWQQHQGLSATLDPQIGILAIAFDPQTPNQVYLNAYGDGVYQSQDGGISWNKIPGSPSTTMNLAIAGDRTLYVTSDQVPGVRKYRAGQWQDITPTASKNEIFNGLTIHPHHPETLLVMEGEKEFAKIYRTQDGGRSWVQNKTQLQNNVPWLPDSFFSAHPAAIQFDYQNPNRVWFTDWFGIWRTEEINANPTVWRNYPRGHEQLVIFTLVAPPEGALLLSAVADVDGFYHSRLDTYPLDRMGYPNPRGYGKHYLQDTYSLDYSARHPLEMVRVGGRRYNKTNTGATSRDGGRTWQRFRNFPEEKIPLRVAVSATDPQKFLVTFSEEQPLQTQDGGVSWQEVQGLPDGFKGPWNWVQPLAADGVNGDRFYYYRDRTVYRSQDGGLSFAPVYDSLPAAQRYMLKTMPEVEGEVWVSLETGGLHRSENGGETFNPIATVERSDLFSFGKPPDQSNIPALYLYGRLTDGREGIFLSLDLGETWRNIDDPNRPIGSLANSMDASKQHFGLVFMGTNGRGIYYQTIQPDH